MSPDPTRVLLFNKPWGVLSQFTDAQGRPTLAGWIQRPGFYVAGRLDRDSEGLLVLTDNGALQQRICQPGSRQWKTYLLQVEGRPGINAMQRLRAGVKLKDGMTLPSRVSLLAGKPGWLWKREVAIRERRKIPTSWLQIAICEGRNRQLRRMCATVGLPVLRLVRIAVGEWSVEGLAPGELREVEAPQ